MLRRVNFYSICFAFGLSVLLILAGSRYTDNTSYHPSSESRRTIRNFLRVEDGDYGILQAIPTNPYDIDKILDRTRSQIRLALSSYIYNLTGAHQLEDLVLEAGGRPKRSIIISTWRSGTTFLGEILDAIPGNFYHYEPLLKYDQIQIRGPPHDKKALSDMKRMLQCDFDGMEDYFEFGKTHSFQFSHNSRLWDQCRYKKTLCYDADFTARFCKLFPFQSMKVVRLRLRLMQDLLEDKELNIKVVLLIRDPRGVVQSRQHRDFCPPSPDCWRPELLCADMISDYVAAGRLLQLYPDRFKVIRYEELALQPNVTVYNLMKFLGFGIHPAVESFLHKHTTVASGGVSSTFRVSKNTPFRWKQQLNFTFVESIQGMCKEAMELWGYRMAHNASHLKSSDFDPLQSYTVMP